MTDDWKAILQQREMARTEFVKPTTEFWPYTSQWATAFAIFEGFTRNPHTDKDDEAPSLLLNFGASAILETQLFRLEMQPGDVVLLDTSYLTHHSYPAPLQDGKKKRWAISCIWRKDITKRRLPSNKKRACLASFCAKRMQKRRKSQD